MPPLIASAGIRSVYMDFETEGLKWWKGHRSIGFSLWLPDGRSGYYPYKHKTGGNLPIDQVLEWRRKELRNVHITNLNTRFDVHISREDGVDLEEQGCTFSDVAHYAAELDDHRKQFSLEALCDDYLDGEHKVKTVDGVTLDPTRMADYHPSMVAVRAVADVRQVHLLKEHFWPLLDSEDLQRIRELEDGIIPIVCECEKNGARIDLEKLHAWRKAVKKEIEQCARDIFDMTGLRVSPKVNKEMQKLFACCHVPLVRTENDKASFKDEVLQKHLDKPPIAKARRMSKLLDLDTKYLKPYTERVDETTGILRFSLHQLRSQKDEHDSTAVGTISGRFSSTAFEDPQTHEKDGCNIQQVTKPAKQRKKYGDGYIIRELMLPDDGTYFLSADARQIEYRLFAHYANNPEITAAYAADPLLSFHERMHAKIQPYQPEFTYNDQKNLNFAYIYGAGLIKQAWMLGFITEEEFDQLSSSKDYNNPKLAKMKEIRRIYERELPEVKPLIKRAVQAAEGYADGGTRVDRNGFGFVKTIMGRRSRFPGKRRTHKALNAIIQGSAADIMKQKMIELHKSRKSTGFKMCWTVHDEVDGYVHDRRAANMVHQLLDRQSFKLKIPILWEVSIGKNWAEACD
jgi:DNA polymerase-1